MWRKAACRRSFCWRTSSLEFSVVGRLADGTLSFEGRLICAFVDDATHTSRPIPEIFRAAIAHELALGQTDL